MQVRHIKVEMQSTVVTGCVGRSWRTVAQTGRCFVKQTLLLFGRHFHIAALRAGDGSLESNQSLLLRFPLFGRRPGVRQRTQVPSRMRLRLTKIKTLTEHLWLTSYANYLYIWVSGSATNGPVDRIIFYFLHKPLETRHSSIGIPHDNGIVVFRVGRFQFRQQLFTQVRRVGFGQCGVVIAHFSDIAVPESFGQSRLWRHFFDLSMRRL